MEGYLGKYKSFVSGYKKYYCKLTLQAFVILQSGKDSEIKAEHNLRNARVESSQSASKEFTLTVDLNSTLAGDGST